MVETSLSDVVVTLLLFIYFFFLLEKNKFIIYACEASVLSRDKVDSSKTCYNE